MKSSSPETADPLLSPVQQPIDALTVACIAIVSYLCGSVVHEGIGHGIAAALLGARDIQISSAALHLDSKSVSPIASQMISIAGPLTGLLIGWLLAIYHGKTQSKSATFRYFVWLTGYVCLFANGGYLMALSLMHFGDIHGFVQGLAWPIAWRLGLTVLGTILSIVALFTAGRSLDEFLGQTDRRSRAAKLLLISIPATLGGTVFLPYTILCVGNARPTTKPVPFTPCKSLPWYIAGAIALLIYGLVLGPGVPR
jgi:hypothetical protein